MKLKTLVENPGLFCDVRDFILKASSAVIGAAPGTTLENEIRSDHHTVLEYEARAILEKWKKLEER